MYFSVCSVLCSVKENQFELDFALIIDIFDSPPTAISGILVFQIVIQSSTFEAHPLLLFFFFFKTLSWMERPRCGVPDKLKSVTRSRRRRFALTGQKWQRTHITYRCDALLWAGRRIITEGGCYQIPV